MNKKIATLVAALLILAIASISMSLAYFTDTDAVKNEFTVGNVEIDLTEGAWIRDIDPESDTYGDIIPAVYDENLKKVPAGEGVAADRDYVGETAPEASVNSYGKLYPGMSVYKDPIIKNTGAVNVDEDAFVAAKVTITDGEGDIWQVIGVEGYDNIDISNVVSGGLASQAVSQDFGYNGLSMVYKNDNYAVYQDANKAEGTYVLYFFIEEALKPQEEICLFDHINIDANWTNEQMLEFKELGIEVKSYAVQTSGFADCFTAMTTAFPAEFDF
ncbi:MAG: hypothetical protein IJC49_05790 [Clostridia bacterium]|nr:hypothetical protein [Clostridia bacterium]